MAADEHPEPGPEEQADTQADSLRAPGESVLDVMHRAAGIRPRVLLRDTPGEESPVLRVHSRSSEEAAQDDSRYQVLGEIGRGGVGIIFKSRDRDLGRDVAMKVLRPEMAAKAHVVERFIEEAQVAGQLQHPGVVPVYGMGLQDDGRPFFTMKLVKGKTLAALLAARRGPADERRRFLGVFEQICQTIAYAHARGVVHRDLKPANVMVGAFGEVQIMDWGFAKVLGRTTEAAAVPSEDSLYEAIDTVRSGSEGSQSIAGAVMGTPAYMPPEQAMGRIDALDERADVFALGSILCEILTGRPAYAGESTEQLVLAARGQIDDALERIAEATVAQELKDLATACLSPAAAARPRDAGVVSRELGDHLAAVQMRARKAELAAAHAKAEAEAQRQALLEEQARAEREQAREAQRQREAAWAARSRKRALVLAALIIVGLLVGSGAWYGIQSDRDERARDATERIHRALREASQMRARGSWDPALEAVAMARELASQHVDDRELAERVERLGAQILAARDEAHAEALRSERNAGMVATLEDIGSWVARQNEFAPRGDDPFGVERRYAEAFQGFGVEIEDGSETAAVARIRDSGIHDELTSALDDWVWVRRVGCGMEAATWQPLLTVANQADADPFRARLRAAIHGTSGRELRALAAEADLATLSARTVAMLGRALIEANDFGTATRLLREGQRLHPAHIGINHYLAYVLASPAPRPSALRKLRRADLLEALCCRSAIAGMRPQADESWLGLGHVLLQLDRFAEAREAFWRAIELDPTAQVGHVAVGMSHTRESPEHGLLDRDYEREARRRDVEPDLSAFRLGLGLGHLLAGRSQEAIPLLEEALAASPEAGAYNKSVLALAYARVGRTEEALRSAYAALEDGSTSPHVIGIVARDQAYRLGNPKAAVETLDKALGPYGRGALGRMRTDLLLETKQYRRALDLLQPRVLAGNEPPSALIQLGSLRAHVGDIDGAHDAWDQAAEAARETPRIYWTTLASTAWELAAHDVVAAREPGRALIQAELAASKAPRSWIAITGLAAALRANGRLDEAKKAVDAFLRQRPHAGTWLDACRVWAALDEPGLAAAALEAAVAKFPDNPSVLNGAAMWGGVIGPEKEPVLSPERAVELARKAVGLASKAWSLRNTLAYALLRNGDHEEALEQSEIAMSLRTTLHPVDAFVHAMAAWHLGRKAEARTWRERGLQALLTLVDPGQVRETLLARDEALALIEDA